MLEGERSARLAQIRALFPNLSGPDAISVGGRRQALTALQAVDPRAYALTRNALAGKVSRLSAYFRHGALTLDEAADHALQRAGQGAYKFVFELAWRDFWRRVWADKADAIEQPLEAAKVPLGSQDMAHDVIEGETGLACMDEFVRDLLQTGYVHNHARMWFASYVVHHRKIDWRKAADWYYGELLDGDRASNHLSWQWIASTFSSKPYLFNRGNLQQYAGDAMCKRCVHKHDCPFDASYAELHSRLFQERQ